MDSLDKQTKRWNEVLYGCETWPVTLRKEHRQRLFENKVLRRIFGPKRAEVTTAKQGAS
jgi:hypothetical protein